MLQPESYYAGRTLLLTGATGLVGRAVLETLLRLLPDVRRIHVLIRPRTDDAGILVPPAQTLWTEVLGNRAFDALRTRHGEAFDEFVGDRVEAVAGDISQPGLGIAQADRDRLAGEVDLVINCAALAVFDAPLDQALQSNVRGPAHVLEFARSAASPPFVAHVSTCYVNNLAGPVFETWPRPGADDERDPAGRFDVDEEVAVLAAAVAEIEAATGGDPERRRQRLVDTGLDHARRRGWNDTYTFSKALGEQVFARHQGDIPGLILRPAIIESALRNPAPGWIDGFRMVDPLIVGFARGQIFEFPGHPDSVLDVIPVDRVVNALLMAIPWCHRDGGPRVYQVASGMDRPLRLAELRDHLIAYFERNPLRRRRNGARGPSLPLLALPPTAPFLRELQRRYLRPLRRLARLYAPLRSTAWGRQRHATAIGRHGRLQRLYDMAAIYGPYAESRVRYMTCNTRALEQALSPAERENFPCTTHDLVWTDYIQGVHIPGIERYLLRMKRTPDAVAGPEAVSATAGDMRDAPVDPRRWHMSSQVIASTRSATAHAGAAWTRPARRWGLRRLTRGALGAICRSYLRLAVSGQAQIPQRGPCIIVANHCSHADTAVLLAALGRYGDHVHPTAAADYWFRSPVLGWLLHASLSAVPFDRHSKSVPRALAVPAEVLRAGDSLIFYAEGTRSVDGQLQRFRSTLGLLALAAAVPVVPVAITGTIDAMPKGRVLPRQGRVCVRFGEAIRPDTYLGRLSSDSLAEVARDLAGDAHAAVAALAEQSTPADAESAALEHAVDAADRAQSREKA